jgi:dTDP-4-amino-4,6-dideoxygalactose transaminase
MKRVPLVRLELGEPEVEAVARVIRSGWIIQGPEVAAFEQEFAAAVGAPHAVAVSSGTAALELALRALGVSSGDEVVTVSHSFIATVNAIVAVGARPVLVDVEADTFGMDPRRLRAALGSKTKAILCVHQLGIPCDLAGILEAAGDVPVIEDAACAVGSELAWRGRRERIGRPHGRVACFSFHPRKVLTTGDGGMLTTADAQLAERLRSLRQHASSTPADARRDGNSVVFEEYLEPAFNVRMTDLQAALARPQLRRLDAILRAREDVAARYAEALARSPVLEAPRPRAGVRWNWQSYPARLRDGCGVAQKDAMQLLLDRGVATRRGVGNAHQEPAYAGTSRWSSGPGGLALSEQLRDTTILLPIFQGMSDEEQRQVVDATFALGRAKSR